MDAERSECRIAAVDIDERRAELGARLCEVEETFVRHMRERGFDPEQAKNIALPGPLAKLYAELEELRAELQELESN
ncbi:MAG: hypothetical protein ACRD8U_04375 [Pyrinomonadaceae bacterium]